MTLNVHPIGVALAGFGLSGRYLQAPFFNAHPDFNLRAVVTSRAEMDTFLPSVQRVETLHEVLSDPLVQLVSIASPNETHFDFARQALLAGKHILVEKPFVASVQEARELIALAKDRNLHIFIFQNRRFDSDFLTLKKWLNEGHAGRLYRFEAYFHRYKPQPNVKKWKEVASKTSGLVYDLGPHLIDQCVALFGAPKDVWGQSFTEREHSAVSDAFFIHLDYGPLKCFLSGSLMAPENGPRYILRGIESSLVKHGIDPQEDQLKSGMLPDAPDFGRESDENRAVIYQEKAGVITTSHLDTERGDWMRLFQNMADVMLRGAEPLISMDEILIQLNILERVQAKK